jgi:aldose 1-epimerase
MDVITLRADGFGLRLAPEAGGMVTRYWLERGSGVWEWLRPASEAALSRRDGYESAAFPLVPFANRIRGGRFSFADRDVVLPLNRPPERHAIHGQAWQATWTGYRPHPAISSDAGGTSRPVESVSATPAIPTPSRR